MVAPVGKGWFYTPGRPGDRTLDQQMVGLGTLRERVRGKTVLDVGCAEGLISMQLFDHGAAAVHGLEIVPGHVDIGNNLRGSRAVTLEVADVNHYQPTRRYDIVIMLAILQKLRDPAAACMRFALAARELVVLRLPPENAPLVLDERSGMQPFDMDETMRAAGFVGVRDDRGHRSEWVRYYEPAK